MKKILLIILIIFLVFPLIMTNSKLVLAYDHSNNRRYSNDQIKNEVMNVQYKVIGQNVYVECIMPNFTFKPSGDSRKDGEGHIQLYVDQELTDKLTTSGFIIRNLSKGQHQIKLQLVHNDSTEYPLSHSFEVYIFENAIIQQDTYSR